ncbi:MAG: hypothetical protein FWH54_01145 [Methanobrevibacter sp.]|nr:hypothetical protein [Methanobrevibacter sp.]
MGYVDHLWTNSENLCERLEMLVFCLQVVLAGENIDWELPEDFKYLTFDSNKSEHYQLAKKYYEALYNNLGRLRDDMSGELFVTDTCKLPKPGELNISNGD